jgi:hypothetical protein
MDTFYTHVVNANDVDPITLELISDIEPQRLIILCLPTKCAVAYDIASLFAWLLKQAHQKEDLIDPLTGTIIKHNILKKCYIKAYFLYTLDRKKYQDLEPLLESYQEYLMKQQDKIISSNNQQSVEPCIICKVLYEIAHVLLDGGIL